MVSSFNAVLRKDLLLEVRGGQSTVALGTLSLLVLVASPRRVRRTGIRTGVALGKNLASLVVELSRANADAAAGLDTDSPRNANAGQGS